MGESDAHRTWSAPGAGRGAETRSLPLCRLEGPLKVFILHILRVS